MAVNDTQLITAPFSLAAGTDDDLYLAIPDPGAQQWEVKAITITPQAAVAIDGTDYRTTTFKIGSTTIASSNTNTGGTARVEGAPLPLTVSGAAAVPLTGSGTSATTGAIKVESRKTGGTGKVENIMVQILCEKVPAV